MLAGEELNNRAIQREFGISNDHTVSDAAAKLRQEGYRIIKEKRVDKGPGGRSVVKTYWRLGKPAPKSLRESVPRLSPSTGKTLPKVTRTEPLSGSVSEELRRRLLEGEALSAHQAATQFGVSRSLLGTVVATLRDEGYPVVSEKIEGGLQTRFYVDRDAKIPPTENAVAQPEDERVPVVPSKATKPRSQKTIYADLARRFEEGERLNAHDVREQYGVESLRFLAGFLAQQRKKGWIFTRTSSRTDSGWRTVYRLKWAKPKKKRPAWVDEQLNGNGSEAPSSVQPDPPEEAVTETLVPFQGSPVPMVMPDLPPLTISVDVIVHHWDPDTGLFSLGLRNGDTTWLIPVAPIPGLPEE